ncbi:MAG TPA: DMT family transporter [Negativicutes bacterium]
MSEVFVAYTKISLAMAIVGSSVVVGKLIIATFPVFLASELRLLVALIILIPLMIKQEQGIPAISKKDLWSLFWQSLTGIFLFNIFMLNGLKSTSAVETGIITSVTPAVVGLIAYVFLTERLGKNTWIGILLAVIGTLALTVLGSFLQGERGSNPLLGNLLVFGAVFCEAFFLIIAKSVLGRITPLTVSTIICIFAALLFLPLSIYQAVSFDFLSVTLVEWQYVAYYGIVVTVLAFVLMYQGLSKVPASTAGVLTGVLPLSAVVLSHVILREEFLWSQLIGLGCVLSSIVIIARDTKDITDETYTS